MPRVSFIPLESWVACVKAGYIYKIDYPIFDSKDSGHLQYGVIRYKILDLTGLDVNDPKTKLPEPEMIDLGRFNTRADAEKACQDHANADT